MTNFTGTDPSEPSPEAVGAPSDPLSASSPGAPRSTNALAVVSLVLSIVWLFGFGSLGAVVLGFVGRQQIRQSNGAQPGSALALAGIVIGAIGVIGAVVFLLLNQPCGTRGMPAC
jgi:hypothetical protein